ncbi:MAG: hypothetical protein MHMPM18_000718 [Marteilia pararefringens]
MPLSSCFPQLPSLSAKNVRQFTILFLFYTLFHASRRPLVILRTKSDATIFFKNDSLTQYLKRKDINPFVFIDAAYSLCYTISIMFSSKVISKTNWHYFLFALCLCCGFLTASFGLLSKFHVNYLAIWIIISAIFGVSQSFALPIVASLLKASFDGHSKLNIIVLLWSLSMPFGNFVGTFLSSVFILFSWTMPSTMIGAILASASLMVFALDPETNQIKNTNNRQKYQDYDSQNHSLKEIVFRKNLHLYGMICLITKLNLFVFYYWLPTYMRMNMPNVSSFKTTALSNMTDLGGICGIFVSLLLLQIMDSFQYVTFGVSFSTMSIILFFLAHIGYLSIFTVFTFGFSVFPLLQVLITSLVQDWHYKYYRFDPRAFTAIIAILDTFGNVGAFIGPMIAGFLHRISWNFTFIFMIILQLISQMIAFYINLLHRRNTEEYQFADAYNRKEFFIQNFITMPELK